MLKLLYIILLSFFNAFYLTCAMKIKIVIDPVCQVSLFDTLRTTIIIYTRCNTSFLDINTAIGLMQVFLKV